MNAERPAPYQCHIFICTNDRHGVRKSCAEGGGAEIREQLKLAVAERGWRGRVRVSQSGCLGLCEEGPNVMLYPQKLWFSAVRTEDCPTILSAVERILLGEVQNPAS